MTVSSFVDGELRLVADVEIAPRRRAVIDSADAVAADDERPVVVVEASEPVVVGRELRDVSLHVQTVAAISGAEPVPLD